MSYIKNDKEINAALSAEIIRQENSLELIPSENYVSGDVLAALGSVFTNKYSEGYPGKRYYGGQENTDKIESLAINRAKRLFGADHANVQPHSGAQANEAVYHSWLEPGDVVLAMDLSHGGHLTHGHPVTVLAHQYRFVRYKVADLTAGVLDYDHIRAIARKERPKLLLVGNSSFPRIVDYSAFASIGQEVGAVLMADVAHVAGLIAGGVHPNPLDYGFHVMSSTTHKTLRGPRGGIILSRGKVGNPLIRPEKTVDNLPTLIDRTVFPGIQGGPHMHTVAAKAVAFREALQPEFREYAAAVVKNADRLAEALMSRGVTLVTSGTDTHLMLIDCMSTWGIHGGIVETVLDRVGLTTNKNVIPDDTQPPFTPSGVRLGTPAATTRGLRFEHMDQLAEWIVSAVIHRDDEHKLEQLQNDITSFLHDFPLPATSPSVQSHE